MSLINLFKEKYKGKSQELCTKLDECILEYVTEEDMEEHEDMDDFEVGQELYENEGMGDFIQEIITSKEFKDVEVSIEELNEFTQYLKDKSWQTDL
jgi:predicted house-cleaning noncanonical NTP pyrophosphatase (MazG superfamily)